MDHFKGALRWARRYRVSLIVFCACLGLYLVLYLFVPAGKGLLTRTLGDEPHYIVLTQSILRDGDLTLADDYASGDYNREGYFAEGTLEQHVTNGRNGRIVPWHQVMTSLVILPGYAAAGYRGAGATMALIMSAAALFTFLIVKMFARERDAAVVTLFFFLTYPLLAYSHLIFPEVFAVFLLAAGTWGALRLRSGGRAGYLLLSGFAAALLPHFHSKFIVLSAALALLVVLCLPGSRWRLVYFFAPVAASLVGLAVWTWYLYGSNIIRGLTLSGSAGGFLGGDSPWGIPGLYLDRAWGLLPYAPLYIALFAGIPLPRTRIALRRWWFYIPATVAFYTLVVGCFKDWHGGAAPVPRYLVPLLPLFVLCAGLVVSGIKKRWAWVMLAVLAIVQVVFTVFARIYPAATLGLPRTRNELYHFIFGDSFLSLLERIFPLFHPITLMSLAVLCVWIVFLVVLISARRSYLKATPGEMLT